MPSDIKAFFAKSNYDLVNELDSPSEPTSFQLLNFLISPALFSGQLLGSIFNSEIYLYWQIQFHFPHEMFR